VITLVLGGARSGKSAVAERLVGMALPPVTYVATAVVGEDGDLAARVAAHRARRPSWWRTVEVADDLPAVVRALDGVVLVDSLGPWVGWLVARGEDVPADRLADAFRMRSGDAVVVSDEVGLGVHAPTELGRRFADELGLVNQAVSAVAARALLVVAGRTLPLDAV
jgi:adenosyl cobinamide kinase/adenosyl cobinamide phosphate guanylyltransferase